MANKPKKSDIQFRSEIDTEMQMEFEELEGRIKIFLVGVISNRYLVFSVSDDRKSGSLAKITQHTSLTIRGISRGEAFGFRTEIIRIIKDPEVLLFVKYPTFVQHQSIRNSHRVKCLLPAKFAHDTTGIGGIISDISISGCHFQCENDLNQQQAAIIQLNGQFLFSFELPGKEVPKTIEATIKNTYVETDTIHIGFQFDALDTVTEKLLKEFIALSFDISPF